MSRWGVAEKGRETLTDIVKIMYEANSERGDTPSSISDPAARVGSVTKRLRGYSGEPYVCISRIVHTETRLLR
ncbi:hypothetical protein EVAR_60548_1 [Eumeta japonica]|uniref:Uncharacterized protein n=1 Tax=Eumeta variegata TaxID=151549 RepID=A0A4C1YQ02_EUMVA|nr:hypothetical protein EVAR_60548_1 [Eumeta japonica]